MAELFSRRVKVVIAQPAPGADDFRTFSGRTIEITDLRVQFSVVKTSDKEPNTAEITITNLASATREGLQTASKVLLQAGYGDDLGQVYYGDLATAQSKQVGTDWETKLRCGDGERATKHARISESLPPGIPYDKMLAIVGKATKLDLGNLLTQAPRVAPGVQYTQGVALYGPALPILARVLEAKGYELSVQDGKLQVLGKGETTTEEVIVLTPETGLIGSPEVGSPEKKGGKPTLKFESMLDWRLVPGRKVWCRSRHVDGVFIARKVKHDGDTASGPWKSDVEAVQA